MKCKICGGETRKFRQTCINCQSVKEVKHRGQNAYKSHKKRADRHLSNNPGLLSIAWDSFFKKR